MTQIQSALSSSSSARLYQEVVLPIKPPTLNSLRSIFIHKMSWSAEAEECQLKGVVPVGYLKEFHEQKKEIFRVISG